MVVSKYLPRKYEAIMTEYLETLHTFQNPIFFFPLTQTSGMLMDNMLT